MKPEPNKSPRRPGRSGRVGQACWESSCRLCVRETLQWKIRDWGQSRRNDRRFRGSVTAPGKCSRGFAPAIPGVPAAPPLLRSQRSFDARGPLPSLRGFLVLRRKPLLHREMTSSKGAREARRLRLEPTGPRPANRTGAVFTAAGGLARVEVRCQTQRLQRRTRWHCHLHQCVPESAPCTLVRWPRGW